MHSFLLLLSAHSTTCLWQLWQTVVSNTPISFELTQVQWEFAQLTAGGLEFHHEFHVHDRGFDPKNSNPQGCNTLCIVHLGLWIATFKMLLQHQANSKASSVMILEQWILDFFKCSVEFWTCDFETSSVPASHQRFWAVTLLTTTSSNLPLKGTWSQCVINFPCPLHLMSLSKMWWPSLMENVWFAPTTMLQFLCNHNTLALSTASHHPFCVTFACYSVSHCGFLCWRESG